MPPSPQSFRIKLPPHSVSFYEGSLFFPSFLGRTQRPYSFFPCFLGLIRTPHCTVFGNSVLRCNTHHDTTTPPPPKKKRWAASEPWRNDRLGHSRILSISRGGVPREVAKVQLLFNNAIATVREYTRTKSLDNQKVSFSNGRLGVWLTDAQNGSLINNAISEQSDSI